jgi:hypothetical protein
LYSESKKGDSGPAEASTTVEDIPSYFQPAEEVAPQATYQAAPAPSPVQQAPPPTSFWSGVPPLVWIGVGVLLGNVVSTALEFVKGGPQKMQEMAMQQMMKQMMKQAGAPGGAGSPFGMPGAGAGNPFGMPGAGAPSPFGAGFPPPPPSAATSSPIDTTATPFSAEPKKEEPKRETVTPEIKVEGASASSDASSSTKKKSAFVDVDVEKTESSQSTASTASTASTFTPPPPPPPPPSSNPADASSSAGSMLDMLKNPEMQKMLYPYLPEPMRNPETFEWMLNSPEYRAQLEGMLSQQMGAGAPQAVQDLMKDADMSPEKMQEQFDALGMTPEDFVQKVMSDPDLATSMTKPNVMAAIAECTKNPMAIFQYQNDEEVMRVFEKMSGLFPQAAGMGGMPGMPGMPPQNKN